MKLQRETWSRNVWSGWLGPPQPSPGSKGRIFLRQSSVEGLHLSGSEVKLTNANPASSSHPGVRTITWRGLFSQRLAQRCLTLRRVTVDGTPLKVTLGGFTRGDEDEEELSRNTPGPRQTSLLDRLIFWWGSSPRMTFLTCPRRARDGRLGAINARTDSLRRCGVGLGAGRREEPGEKRWILRREAKLTVNWLLHHLSELRLLQLSIGIKAFH